MKKLITTLGLIWVLALSLITTGCPKDPKTSLEAGFAASVRISSYGTDLTKGFTKLRQDGAISQPVFESLINKLDKVAVSGRKVHNVLAGFVERFPDGNVPPSEFKPVALLFNSDVYGPVIELLGIVAGLSPANQTLVSLAMTGLKTAVNTIRGLMDRFSLHLGLPIDSHKGVYYVTA